MSGQAAFLEKPLKKPKQEDMDKLINQTTRGFSRENSLRQQDLARAMSSAGPDPFEDAGLLVGNIKDLVPEADATSSEKAETDEQDQSDMKTEDETPAKRKWWHH